MQNQNQNTSVVFPDSNPDEGGASVSYDQNSLNSQALSLDPTQPSSSAPADTSIAAAEQAQPKRPGTLVKLAKRADVALAILLILGSIGLVLMSYLREEPVANNSATSRFDTTQLPLEDLVSSADGISFGAQSVIINGNLRANDGLIIAPSLQPTGAVAGQIYYDQTSNMLSYYNGSQFVPVGSGVQSVGGLTGQIAIGGGLSVTSGQITNSGVLSVQGLSGNVVLAAGNGISVSGTTISNDGVVSIVSNTPSLVVADDGNGNVTLTGSGAGTVNSSGGTVGSIPVFTASQTIEDSIITQSGTTITVNGALNVTGGLTLSTPLTVANGGTGANSLALNGVLIGQGTSPITSVVAGAPGLCFVSTAGTPTWGSCTGGSTVTSLNGLTGALTIANATGAGSTITIDDASTGAKGIAQFNSTNFTVGSGVVNTIQNINPAATPTFAGVNTNNITPGAALTVGVSGQTALLQGSTTTITSNGAGNNIVLNSANTIELQDSTNVTGNLSVSEDLAVNGGDVTSTGALNITPGGTLTAGASGQTLTLQGNASTSLRATSGANTTIVGFTNPVANTTLNFPALSAGTYTICTTSGNCAGAGVTLQAAYNNSSSPEIVLDATRGALSIQDNATPLGANLLEVQSNGGGTTYLAVTSAGIAVTGTATATGNINSSGGALQTGGTTRIDGSGNLTNIGSLTLSGAISGGTTIAGSGNINSTGGAIQTNSTTRIDNSGNLVNIAAITASGNAALQGGTVTLGTSSQAGSVVINDGSSNTGTLQVAPLGQNTVYTLPDPGAGTATICLSTGNCSGTGGGVTTPGGTANRLPVFTGAQTVGNSWLLQNGSTLELDNTRNLSLVGGNLTLQSGNVSVTGTVSVTGDITTNTQVRILESTGATFYANLDVGDLGSDQTFTFLQGGTVVTSGNASTYATTAVTAGGGLTGGGTTGVLTLDIGAGNGVQVNANDIAVVYGSSANTAVQGNTQLTVTAGTNLTGGGTVTLGAGGTLTVNVADSPTFAGNIVAQGGSITVGVSAQAGTLNLYDGGSGVAAHTGALQVIGTLAQNTTYTLPDPGAGTATICLNTGNCAGAGGGITGTGTTNTVPIFTGAQTIGDSIITQSGTTIDIAGSLTLSSALGVAYGGTGLLTTPTNGQLLIGNGSGYTLATLTNNGGLTISNGAGSIGLAVNYGAVAGTAVQGSVTLVCPAGTGNLNGGGNTITLGSGGTCSSLNTVNNPTFSTSVTTPLLASTGALDITPGGALTVGATGQTTAVQGSTVTLTSNGAGNDITLTSADQIILNSSGTIELQDNTNVTGTLAVTGAVTGGTYNGQTISSSASFTGTLTTAGNINTTGGALQTAGTSRIDNSGNLVNIGNITATGAATIQGGLTVGASAQAGSIALYDGGSGVAAHTGTLQVISTLAQNTTFTLPDPGGASATICLSTGNCAGSGGGITGSGTNNRVAKFTGSGSIGDSTITDDGTNVSVSGNITIQGGTVTAGADAQVGTLTLYDGGTGGSANTTSLVAGSSSSNLTFILPTGAGATNQCIKKGSGNQLIWDNCDGGGGGSSATFQTVYNNSSPAAFTLDSTNGGLLIQDNATPIGASLFAVQNNAGSTTYLDVTSAGINVAGAATVSGNINTSGGALQTAGTTRIDVSGNLTNIGTLSLSGAISGGTTITGSGNINTTGGSLQTNSTTRVDNGGNLVNIGNITASGSATLQGGIVTLGTSAQAGSIALYDGGSGVAAHTGTLQVISTLGQNTTYTLPDPGAGTATICLNTGNCASSGGGVTTAGGTTNRLPVFSGAQTIADSWLLQNGSTLELDNTRSLALLGGDLTLQGGNVSVTGTMSATSDITSNTQVRILESTGATYYGILDVGDLAADQTFTFLQGGTVVTNNNIATYATTGVTAGGGLTGGGTTGVLTLDIGAGNGIQVNANDIAVVYGSTANTAVQGNTQITVTAGTNLTGGGTLTLGAGGTLTVNVANSPTFSGNVIAQGGTLTVGASAQSGTLNLYDGGSGVAAHTGALQVIGTLGQNTTYTLPDPGGASATICLNTGNCASSGGGVTTAGGTANRLPVFNGAQTLTNSWLLQNSSTLELDNTRNLSLLGGNLSVTGSGTFSGDLAVDGGDITSSAALNVTPGGALTLGDTGQTATLQGSVTTITSTGAGNDIVLNSADTIELQDNTFVTGNLQIQDASSPTKSYRLRTNGTDLDFESGGAKMYISNWTNADYTGTQRTYLVFENASSMVQAIGGWHFRTAADGTTRHIIDGSTGTSVAFNQTGESTDFSVQGDSDTNLFFIQGSSDRVGIGTNTPGFKLDVNGTLGVTGNTTLTGDLAVDGGDISSSAALNITPGGLFTLGATGQQFILQGNASSTITATGGGFTTTVGFTGTPTGAVTFNFDRSEAPGTYTICTTANNCVGTASSLQDAYDVGNTITTTNNRNIVFNLADTATDSSFLVDLQCDTSCSTNGRFAIQDDGVDVFTISPATGIANFKSAANTQAFNIDNASGDNLFTVDSQNSRVGINLGGSTTPTLNGSGLQIQGGLRLSGGGSGSLTDTYTTPGGSNINAKINIVNYDPGDGSNTMIAAGLPTTASSISSTVISVFDPRSNANHWPTISVWSPDESKLFGLTWAGSDTEARLTTHNATGNTGSVAVQSGDSAGVSTTTGNVAIRTGNGVGTSVSTGSITIDAGSPNEGGTAGAISIGTTNSPSITIGNGSNATAVSVLCGTGDCGFGNNAVAHTTTVGSVTGAATTTLQGGTGGVNVGTGGIANTVQIGNTTGAVTQTINLGNNATASSVTNVTIGSLIGASSLALQVGTGNFTLNGVAGTTYSVGSSTTTGTISIGGTAQTGNITLGSSSGTNTIIIGGGTGATTVNIAGATTGGAVNIGASMTTGTITIGGTGAQTGLITIGGGTGAQTIHFGTGGTGAKTVSLGSTASTSTTTVQAGTGGVALISGANITIGTSDTTGTLLILDTKTSSGDPSGVNGAMYYSADRGKMRCYEADYWRDCDNTARTGYYFASELLNVTDGPDIIYEANNESTQLAVLAGTAAHPSILEISADTASTGAVAGMNSAGDNAILFGGGSTWRYETVARIPTLSDGTNTFTYRAGFADGWFDPSNDQDTCIIRYGSAINSGRWQGYCSTSGTSSVCDTGITVGAGTWYRLTVIVTATTATFQTDGTTRCTVTTNIPTGGTNQTAHVNSIHKTAGATDRTVEVDYLEVRGEVAPR